MAFAPRRRLQPPTEAIAKTPVLTPSTDLLLTRATLFNVAFPCNFTKSPRRRFQHAAQSVTLPAATNGSEAKRKQYLLRPAFQRKQAQQMFALTTPGWVWGPRPFCFPFLCLCFIICFLLSLEEAKAEGGALKSLPVKKKSLVAPQALAGEISLSCPIGFDMVEGECVKIEVLKPQVKSKP